MTKTLEMNGPARKTLASQLDRLDGILDGLSEGLSDAVASAVREAVGVAVQEAVQAVLTELLTNPALREQLQKAAPPTPPPPAERAPAGGTEVFRGGRCRGWQQRAIRLEGGAGDRAPARADPAGRRSPRRLTGQRSGGRPRGPGPPPVTGAHSLGVRCRRGPVGAAPAATRPRPC